MRTWNLSTLSDLEDQVVLTFQHRPRRRPVPNSSGMKVRFTVAAAVAGLTAAFALHYPLISTPVVSISQAETNIAQSVRRNAPPLSALFEGRFADSWSKEEETRALQAMAATATKKPAEYDQAEMIDVVLANQQESLASDVPRLVKKEVLQIIKKRRSV